MFQVAVASRDLPMLEALRDALGFGSIRTVPPEHAHWQPRSVYVVNSRRGHFLATIPFMERYLLASHKRDQFERWRDALIEHERAHPSRYGKGPSLCSEPGCDKAVRGRGRAGATITVRPATEERADFIGGFVAAEGCFTGDGDRRFRFNLGLGASDASMCELIHEVLGVGGVSYFPRRKPHYDDEVQFTVQATRDLVEVVVPFMDAHLPPSYKREQYLVWRARLLEYWEHGFRRRKRCSVDDCSAPARAHGYCRKHLWQFRRQ